jgi:spore germination protein YaaH
MPKLQSAVVQSAGVETATIVALQPRAPGVGPCATVFGYLPYWNKTVSQQWSLLTHAACFSVVANADGSINNRISWPWTTQINAAHNAGVKIILVVTQFDPDTSLTLVTTETAKSAFFTNIKALMLAGKADGLNIDFEGSGTYRSYINQFMADLTTYLHAQIPGCEVTFAGPAVNWSNSWDLLGLASSCDGIFIMGYDFYGSWSSTSGPSSPLTGGSINITNTVNTQYKAAREAMPEKLILGIPYYGNHWKTATSDPRSTASSYVTSMTFNAAMTASQSYGLLWDSVSQTPWCKYNDGTDWHQIWFDNVDSLRLKYRLAQTSGLQGVGMWCLGNDSGRSDLWNLLRDEYVTNARMATVVAQDFPATMMAGSTATATIDFQNTGSNIWKQASVRLGTWGPQDRSSPFYTAGNWIGANRPAAMDVATCPRDGTARFTFTLTAPATAGTYVESWRLVEEGVAWFGPTDVQFQIVVTPKPVPGDFDGDLDVDQDDFGRFQLCLSEIAAVVASPDCTVGDLNHDTFVDARDTVLFINCMTGPGIPGNPDCP